MTLGDHDDTDEIPKVERVVTSQPLSHPRTLQMLSQFLMEEQERRQSLRETFHLGTTWKDLQNAYETVASFTDPALYDTFETGNHHNHNPNHNHHGNTFNNNTSGGANNNNNNTSNNETGGTFSTLALSAAQSFMGSPEMTPAQKEKKIRRDRKKKRKEAKKEAKRHAKQQAKLMIAQDARRF
jgi:hypothetical protein